MSGFRLRFEMNPNPEAIDVNLLRALQCFTCGQFFMACACTGEEHGGNYQFMVDDADLPARDGAILDNVKFWGKLVKHGILTMKFNFDKFFDDMFIRNRTLLDLMTDAQIQAQMRGFWAAAVDDATVYSRILTGFPSLQNRTRLKAVGTECLDSFFSGRWHEMCQMQIELIYTAIVTQGPDPYAPSSARLKQLTDAFGTVEMILGWVSKHPMYTLVATDRLTHMTRMETYQPTA